MEGDPPILLFTTLLSCDKCMGVLSSACNWQLLVGTSKMFCNALMPSPEWSPISLSLVDSQHMQLHDSSVDSSQDVAIAGTGIPTEPDAAEMPSTLPQQWHGFKIVGDNTVKSVKPWHETMDHHTHSLHYFHSFAVGDQIDFSHLSCVEPDPLDLQPILANFSIIISWILVQYQPYFHGFSKAVVDHIPHKYSQQMSTRSKVVSLCINSLYTFHLHLNHTKVITY